VKFSLREIGRIFSIKIPNFKLWEMPKILNLRFPEGCYFFDFDNTEQTGPLNFFSVSERQRWAVVD